MDTNLVTASHDLVRTTERMVRVGLIVDPHALSPANRRALFVLQCQVAEWQEPDESRKTKIGFPYPNER